MKPNQNNSRRVHSYDFFRGVIGVGLIFFLTFFYLFPGNPNIEFFYRWAHLGFLFFFGLIAGQSTLDLDGLKKIKKSKKILHFFRKGIQILGIFLGLNILFQLPMGMDLMDFSLSIVRGEYNLVTSLLLPLGILFVMIPFLYFVPNFLGLAWSISFLFLLDFIALEHHLLSLNAFLISFGLLGFYIGRTFSLESLREKWNTSYSILPFFFLYLAFGILLIGETLGTKIFSFLSEFWSFHALVLLLFYFSLPNSLFHSIKGVPKSALRKFFEPLGIDLLFLYISVCIVLEILKTASSSFILSNILQTHIFAIHLTIFFFAIITLLQKIGKKNKVFRKTFRFLF